MSVKLRLRREGTKKAPFYRIVAADSRSPRDGRFIEIVGVYRPLEDPSGIDVDAERALHWLRVGAQPSDAVRNILRISGVWQQFRPDEADVGDRAARRAAAAGATPAAKRTGSSSSSKASE